MTEPNERRARENDLVLAPNEYAYIEDDTKGHVDVYVGPHKTSLANTDQPVIFNAQSKTFDKVSLEKAKTTLAIAPEGWYLVLKNPAKDKDKEHPTQGTRSGLPPLETGKKINIPGPVAFALWPGQMVVTRKGHEIRSNQYLLVRVYDEAAAKENWNRSVVKSSDDATKPNVLSVDPKQLTMGRLLVIKGTDVSFYIPPTGVEVVADENGKLVRDAVTLERLEFCLLKDQDGNKRYVQGPAVVFPEPTEIFVERPDVTGEPTRKMRAIELSDTSGIYVKVIADYTDGEGENAVHHFVGEELFLTGKEIRIYFPREEHAIIKYGEHEIHYGIAIPAGEARYVLDRNQGSISLVKGPIIFLPDPRKEVVVQRVLDLRLCEMLFPNNEAALLHNAKLAGIDLNEYRRGQVGSVALAAAAASALPITDAYEGSASPVAGGLMYASLSTNNAVFGDSAASRGLNQRAAKGFAGDSFNRKGQYVEPRSITLNTRYNGAVSIDVWTGYAVMLVRKNGDRRVVVGPQTVLLEYDEVPQILELSRGKPKTTDNLLRTPFLRIHANKVSDEICVTTRDFCKLFVKVSYRLDFENTAKDKWFDVENYVKFMCDHQRSKLGNAVRKHSVEEFYTNAIDIVRDVVLGKAPEGGGPRPGTTFPENGMRVYDIEVLNVRMENAEVEALLMKTQREVIQQTLLLATQKRKLDFTRQEEDIKQQTAEAQARTKDLTLSLQQESLKKQLEFDLATIAANSDTAIRKYEMELASQTTLNKIEDEKLSREKAKYDLDAANTDRKIEQRVRELNAEVEGLVKKASAVSPDLIAALSAFGDKALIERISQSMAPLSILGGESVTDILGKLLQGTKLAEHLLPKGGSLESKNGHPRA